MNNMTPELWRAVMEFAVRFGLNAAIALLERIGKPGATIDDAIAALAEAQAKSAEDYLAEARRKLGGTV